MSWSYSPGEVLQTTAGRCSSCLKHTTGVLVSRGGRPPDREWLIAEWDVMTHRYVPHVCRLREAA
ncbi:MAG: hypothetical protein Q8N51_00750 [Gammaproteobacteria bacterium]|nr:hypothetical protein [Gammaproteobacteria bacterium]